jgi:hypothetical protein
MNSPHGVDVEISEYHFTWVYTQKGAPLLPIDAVAIGLDRDIYTVQPRLYFKRRAAELHLTGTRFDT